MEWRTGSNAASSEVAVEIENLLHIRIVQESQHLRRPNRERWLGNIEKAETTWFDIAVIRSKSLRVDSVHDEDMPVLG